MVTRSCVCQEKQVVSANKLQANAANFLCLDGLADQSLRLKVKIVNIKFRCPDAGPLSRFLGWPLLTTTAGAHAASAISTRGCVTSAAAVKRRLSGSFHAIMCVPSRTRVPLLSFWLVGILIRFSKQTSNRSCTLFWGTKLSRTALCVLCLQLAVSCKGKLPDQSKVYSANSHLQLLKYHLFHIVKLFVLDGAQAVFERVIPSRLYARMAGFNFLVCCARPTHALTGATFSISTSLVRF